MDFRAQHLPSSRGEASRPTGGGRPRRCCADGRRRGEDAPPGVRRVFSPPPSPPGSPPARRSFRPIAPAVISRRSDHRPPGVSPAGAAATIPSHPADGRGGFRRRSRRCLVSGAGRRPVHPAAGGCPSSVRTDDGAASGGASRRPELPTLRRQRRLSLSLSLFLSRRRELVIGVTNSRLNEGFFDEKCAPSPGPFGPPSPTWGRGKRRRDPIEVPRQSAKTILSSLPVQPDGRRTPASGGSCPNSYGRYSGRRKRWFLKPH